MRFLSLFSGYGGMDLGLERAGMECVGQAEIDKDCLRVLEHHWPDVRRWTDVRDVDISAWESASEGGSQSERQTSAEPRSENGRSIAARPDLICGGFPCQDVSVAGKRAGLDGARSGLWFECHRIVSELRPKYVLVENVPGLLSSNEGRDFAVIIDGLGELGYGVSWAVLDAQHFGVPQRRRRVFIVAGPTVERTEAILALAEGCTGHSQAGREAGEDVARPLGASATSFGGQRYDLDNETTYVPELSPALTRRDYKSTRQDVAEPAFVAHSLRAEGFDASEDGTGRGTPLVTYGLDSELNGAEDVMGPLKSQHGGSGELAKVAQVQWASGGGKVENPTAQALRSGAEHNYQFARIGASVRRLTPTECLRLMSMPDDWLDLDPPLSDGTKYRMCGNGVVASVAEWIGRRMMAVEAQS